MLLKSQLNQKGFLQIDEANSGENAVKISGKEEIDFIIMDVKLNGAMDGIEAMNNINTHREIPFIIVSAYQHIDQESLQKIPGYAGFFQKPLTEQNLNQIKNLMNNNSF